ncbi:S8 family serine peptidase [Planosporangium sp. 12N6]|uniref:S8 family serine peptidase n=1 Tax=Planosporangium spinosum TaxID=3402278 RepID=UPI003CF29142
MSRDGTRQRRPVRWLATIGAFAVVAGPAVPGALWTPPVAYAAGAASTAHPPSASFEGGLWQASDWSSTATATKVSDIATMIGAPAGADGSGVGVALIDTGVVQVPGLPATQVVNGPDLSFESQGSTVRYLDTFGHGTHMAGIIMGNDPAAGFRGLAPGAKLTSVKVGTAQGAVDVSQMIAAVDWVVAHRNDDPANPIRVINLAYGSNSTQPASIDPLSYALENAWRHGIVVVVSGGNTGLLSSRLTNPAYDPFVLSVGSASTKGTAGYADDELSLFSSVSTSRNVDLLAPGESIVSLRDPGSSIDKTFPIARVGDRLFRGTGSSQATAVVSGAVALLLQQRPNLTPDQVKALLKSSATPLTVGKATSMRLGELNLGAALAKPTPAATQNYLAGFGVGSLELGRGTVHVSRNGVPLLGEVDLFGPFNAAVWAQRTSAGTAWKGGVWMDHRMAGDGWTGTSWASRTWAPATWSGSPWGGSAKWADDEWDTHYWTGTYWSGTYWSGTYWSGTYWSGDRWSGGYWR